MMQEFDPRRPAFRIAPRLLMGVAGALALMLGWRLTGAEAHLPSAGFMALDGQRLNNLQISAFAGANVQPGLSAPQTFDIEIQGGETLEAAIRRAGVTPDEAKTATGLLAEVFDTVHIQQGFGFKVAVARPADGMGEPLLAGLALRTGPTSVATLSRTYDGQLHLRQMTERVLDETTVAQGGIENSFYETAADQGATDALTTQAARLFSHKIDFSRDIRDGDTFKMVFTRKVTESGRTVEAGDLLYAEVDAGKLGSAPVRFYRYEAPGSADPEYFDETGRNIKGFLLATPLAVARITSSFGMRLHPVLGYNKIHQGVDFAGAVGTPIYAAGDGVVVEAGRKGGYGNWIQIRHDGSWSTGYAHMSRFATGMRVGQHVRQGEVIGYIGATGQVTGPHLHFEIMRNGAKVNPRDAKVPAGGTQLKGAELAAFETEKARIDGLIHTAQTTGKMSVVTAEAASAPAAGLRVALR